jgi:hypothetical protein
MCRFHFWKREAKLWVRDASALDCVLRAEPVGNSEIDDGLPARLKRSSLIIIPPDDVIALSS